MSGPPRAKWDRASETPSICSIVPGVQILLKRRTSTFACPLLYHGIIPQSIRCRQRNVGTFYYKNFVMQFAVRVKLPDVRPILRDRRHSAPSLRSTEASSCNFSFESYYMICLILEFELFMSISSRYLGYITNHIN